MRSLAILAAFALASCGALSSTPPEAQLATVCNSIGAAYETAAAYVQQGKMAPATAAQLVAIEPAAEKVCDPTAPLADPAAALAAAQAYLNQLTLANAGVK